MVDVEFIRKKHSVEGWSIRNISKTFRISRQSVRKALASAQIPTYKLSHPRPCPVMDSYRSIIEAWLKADALAPPKQRHTAKRVYDRLVEEYGFSGGDSTVRRFVRLLKAKIPKAYIPLTASHGEQAQVDWGQAVVHLRGQPTIAHLFCLRLKASAVPFVQAFPMEKLEAFLAGHTAAFEWLGGVPAQCVYDNPKTAVVRILSGPHREEHNVFSSLRAHYLFDSHFCNPTQAHEKGSAENLVGYVRRNALVPVQDFAGWEDLNSHLLAWCIKERERHKERWELERVALRPLPAQPFPCVLNRLAVVSKTSLVTFDRNRYSVPCRLVGQTVVLAASWNRVCILAKGEVIAEHERCHGRGQTILELLHYLPVLAQKPRAANHALVVRQLGGVWDKAREWLGQDAEGYRELTRILLLHQEYQPEEIALAVKEALRIGTLTASVVRQLILNGREGERPKVSIHKELASFVVNPCDLGRYDTLARRVG